MTHIDSQSTADLYQQQKKWFALSSTHRSTMEKTLTCNVRQTLFPSFLQQK
ncbi:hypothetical protein [Bacillus alkalicellulosilyticus]|uniref:hypothetical protein n=1 Tax=Alkalihalobacterium alkalicellulosilyticum TaxID=1912214 RepID=UPI0014839C99|nr:hypothetical protein [Bacillus alkalicellulosilyticus]